MESKEPDRDRTTLAAFRLSKLPLATAALDSVQNRRNHVRTTEGGRATGYASLIAVRNKLKELSTDGSHPAVTVTIKRPRSSRDHDDPQRVAQGTADT